MADPDLLAQQADLEDYLGQVFDRDDRVLMVLQAASAVARSYTGQHLSKVSADHFTTSSKADWSIRLPEMPVIEVHDVTWAGTPLNADQYSWTPAGILWRGIQSWTSGPWSSWSLGFPWPQEVTVSYTHGFDPVPDDIRLAVTQMAAKLIQRPMAPSTLTGETLGDYQWTGSATAGLLGDERALLDAYRTLTFG